MVVFDYILNVLSTSINVSTNYNKPKHSFVFVSEWRVILWPASLQSFSIEGNFTFLPQKSVQKWFPGLGDVMVASWMQSWMKSARSLVCLSVSNSRNTETRIDSLLWRSLLLSWLLKIYWCLNWTVCVLFNWVKKAAFRLVWSNTRKWTKKVKEKEGNQWACACVHM